MAPRSVLFLHNPSPRAAEAARQGIAWSQQNRLEARTHAVGQPFPAEVDLVVSVGGDGTLLRAAALVYPHAVPILAVNAGGLGFLSACDAASIESALAAVASGHTRVERRMRLEISAEGTDLTALNDAAVVGRGEDRFAELEVHVDGEHALVLEGDGLIVSTPTGSTAYGLAAGGPVISPAVQAVLLVPLASHLLGARPLVVSPEAGISVRTRSAVRLLVDGESVRELPAGAEVHIQTARSATLLVRLEGTGSFFARLRDKLAWPG